MKKAILLLCLLVPMMANAGFLSGAISLLKYKNTKIVCYGKAYDANGYMVGTSKLTIENNNNGINISVKCHEYDWKFFFPKKNCVFEITETDMQKPNAESIIDATNYLIEYNNDYLSFYYASDNEGYFSITSLSYMDALDITPTAFVLYKSNGEKLFDDGTKADCGTIRAWFEYVTSHWKNN